MLLATMEKAEKTSRALRFGLGVCGALLLVACSQTTRVIGGGGSTNSSGSGGSTSSGGSGGAPCTTTDPACACVDGKVKAIDADGDGHGTKACAESPGDDCDDADAAFFVDACGGCNKLLGAAPGDACNQCGTQACQPDQSLACVGPATPLHGCSGNTVQVCDATGMWADETTCASPTPACIAGACGSCTPGTQQCNGPIVETCDGSGAWVDGITCSGATPVCLAATCVVCTPGTQQCAGTTTTQVCNSQGAWVNQAPCSGGTPVCLGGGCVACLPGMFMCGVVHSGAVSIPCSNNGSWSSTWTSCSLGCNAGNGKCTLFHPRDLDFEVPGLLKDPGLPADFGRALRTQDALDLAVGIAFG
jgi:hypothetical protein